MPYSLYKARVKENIECSGETYISCGIMTEQKNSTQNDGIVIRNSSFCPSDFLSLRLNFLIWKMKVTFYGLWNPFNSHILLYSLFCVCLLLVKLLGCINLWEIPRGFKAFIALGSMNWVQQCPKRTKARWWDLWCPQRLWEFLKTNA